MDSIAARVSESIKVSDEVKTGGSIAAGVTAALGASVCCAGPFVLVTLGIGGAWLANLRALQDYYYLFVAAALAFFGFAFYRLYLKPAPCAPDGTCITVLGRRKQRIAFWTTLVFAKALVLFPFYAPYLVG
ncbi:MAG: mercuric transporter MerT family protein [Pseudomonadota bacterium]